jgi:hypothetical protein
MEIEAAEEERVQAELKEQGWMYKREYDIRSAMEFDKPRMEDEVS